MKSSSISNAATGASTVLRQHFLARLSPVCTMSLAAYIAPLTLMGGEFRFGDQIIVKRSESLFFLDREFRMAEAGESFTVAAYKAAQKKVFLLTKDGTGREIAVSVSEDAITLAAIDPAAAMADARAALRAKQFAKALHILRQASRGNLENNELRQMTVVVQQALKANDELVAAKAEQLRINGEVARLRKNAAVADRKNPLIAADTSNQDRARRMRNNADAMERKANVAVENAESSVRAALDLIARKELPGSTRVGGHDGLEQWTADEEAIPPLLITADEIEKYKDTLEFINNKLAGTWRKVWFGKRTGKMIVGGDNGVAVFDPTKMSPDIKFSTEPVRTTVGLLFLVQIEGRNGSKAIDVHRPPKLPFFGPTSALKFYARDAVDQKKLVNAFSTLIQMLGGTPDAFSQEGGSD